MSWVVIAHKPSSSDYCMSCLMASYSSDLEIEEFDERERLISFLAEIEFRNEHLDTGEAGYEITIIEGEEVEDESIFFDEAKPILEARLKVEREENQEKERQKAVAAQAAREKREREKLAELKERYPDAR